MRIETVKRGRRTAGTVHYCQRCANRYANVAGEIDVHPPGASASAATVSLDKRGRWEVLKGLKELKRSQEKAKERRERERESERKQAARESRNTHGQAKASGSSRRSGHGAPSEEPVYCSCKGNCPNRKPRNERPAPQNDIKPDMVRLSRDEVMEVLSESDWAYLADERGDVADVWLCFFVKHKHVSGRTSLACTETYLERMSDDDRLRYGVLIVRPSVREEKDKLFLCPEHATADKGLFQNVKRPKALGKAKGTTKDRSRVLTALIRPQA